MTASRQLTLTQKVFVVKGYYKTSENMAVLKKNFEKEFDCKIADSTLGVFYSMIACFERTGSVPQCLFYFVVEDTVSNIENNPRWQPKIVANPITRIEEMESEEEDAEESEGEWFGDTNGGDNDSTSDPLAAGQLMLNPFNPNLKRSPRMATNAYRPNYAEDDEEELLQASSSSSRQNSRTPAAAHSRDFRVGQKFTSYEDLREAFARANFQNFVMANLKTVKMQKAVGLTSKAWLAAPHIKYFYVRWKCLFEKHSMKRNTKCKASISVNLSECGKYMQVRKIVDHNIIH